MRQLDDMRDLILQAHARSETLGAHGPLRSRNGTGCLYVIDRTQGRIGAAMAASTQGAWDLMAADAPDLRRSDAIWVTGERDRIRRDSPILQQPFSALRRGRPFWLTAPDDAERLPGVGGVYRARINPPRRRPWESRKPAQMYVGRSSNVRLRLRQLRHHQFLRQYPWGGPEGIDRIEVLIVKSAGGAHVWTTSDLDRAEEEHIQRARKKGFKVLNRTAGRNGPHGGLPDHAFWWQPDPTGHGAQDSEDSDVFNDPYDHDDPVTNER